MEKKNLVMVVLCVAIGIMAVAYAAFSTQLNVGGTIEATGDFAVTFLQEGAKCEAITTKGLQASSGTPTVVDGTTTASVSVSLITPGDVVQCTIPVKNTGTLAAKYTTNAITSKTEGYTISNVSEPIAVEFVSATSNLAATTTGNVIFNVTYKWSKITQPDAYTSADFDVTVNYAQNIQQ